MVFSKKRITKALIRLRDAQAGLRLRCSQPPEDRFSHVETQISSAASSVSPFKNSL